MQKVLPNAQSKQIGNKKREVSFPHHLYFFSSYSDLSMLLIKMVGKEHIQTLV